MKAWEYGRLRVGENHRYLKNGDKPFFWLGDTAWLLFEKCSLEEAYSYLKNRKEKGYTVIQAVLFQVTAKASVVKTAALSEKDCTLPEYWEHCDQIIRMAEDLGLYMALLPAWGAVVKKGILNLKNVKEYADFLGKRYQDRPNVIWLLGGDVRGTDAPGFYEEEGRILKEWNPERLIGYHPFGRTSSALWYGDQSWLDFNMFQSGHRRYDQASLGEWDDNEEKETFFGEDNWKYVKRDLELCPQKPTVDGEPSYEGILQGLHDRSQPYWEAKDARRYAYWSLFQGAMGHTYGDNAVMQFHDNMERPGAFGVREVWQEAVHHRGSGQMKYLKELMESVDYQEGRPREELLLSGQKEKYHRISLFGAADYLFAYSFLGEAFTVDVSQFEGRETEAFWFDPSTGVYSFIGRLGREREKSFCPIKRTEDGNDWVLVLKAVSL